MGREPPYSFFDLRLIEHAVAEDEPQRRIRLLTEIGKDLRTDATGGRFERSGFDQRSPGGPGERTKVQAEGSRDDLHLVVEVLFEARLSALDRRA